VIKLREIKRIKIRGHYYWQLRSNKGKLVSQIRYKKSDKEKVFILAKENGSFYEGQKNQMLSPNGKVIEHTIDVKRTKKGREYRRIPKSDGRQIMAIASVFVDRTWIHGASQLRDQGYPQDQLIDEAKENMIKNLGRIEAGPDGYPIYDEELRSKRAEKINLSDIHIAFRYYTSI